MGLVYRSGWSLLGSLAYIAAVANAAGVLEIDVVFPRTSETYAPTDQFPIVFALQNAQLAKNLAPSIQSFVRNGSRMELAFGHSVHDLTDSNYSSEPYFVFHWVKLETEGPYQLFSTTSWRTCDESGDEVTVGSNSTNFLVPFNVHGDGLQVDLVAATADEETCSAQEAVAIDVTDQTHDVPERFGRPSGTCAVLGSSSPAPNPCAVKVDTAVVESMSAVYRDTLCRSANPPADCPKEDSTHKMVVAGAVTFSVALGAIGFLLV